MHVFLQLCILFIEHSNESYSMHSFLWRNYSTLLNYIELLKSTLTFIYICIHTLFVIRAIYVIRISLQVASVHIFIYIYIYIYIYIFIYIYIYIYIYQRFCEAFDFPSENLCIYYILIYI